MYACMHVCANRCPHRYNRGNTKPLGLPPSPLSLVVALPHQQALSVERRTGRCVLWEFDPAALKEAFQQWRLLTGWDQVRCCHHAKRTLHTRHWCLPVLALQWSVPSPCFALWRKQAPCHAWVSENCAH